MTDLNKVHSAMLLSAGLGTRMRPLTLTMPKPLVKINGQAMLDRALDAVEKAGVTRAVVNVHHLADQIEAHLRNDTSRKLDIILSDERETLLDSAGGVVKALPFLGSQPFYILNSDTFWIDSYRSNLLRLRDHFNPETMDILIMTVARRQLLMPERGDFLMDQEGRLTRAGEGVEEAVIYGGALLVKPEIFADAQAEPHSLNLYFDRAIAKGRLFGLPLEGQWYTVGTVEMIGVVEAHLATS